MSATFPAGQIALPSSNTTPPTSVFVDFTPSTTQAFSFQVTLAGKQYNATIVWNVFGQRYFLNLTDLLGNLVLYTALVATGPQLNASVTWNEGSVAIVTDNPHNLPVGNVVRIRLAGTNSGFDGFWNALVQSPNSLIYQLTTDPNQPDPVNGTVNLDVNLVGGLGIGWMVFHFDTQQFECSPT